MAAASDELLAFSVQLRVALCRKIAFGRDFFPATLFGPRCRNFLGFAARHNPIDLLPIDNL